MISLNKNKIQKEISSGGINKLVVIFGVISLVIGGIMGGDYKFYIIFLIIIPAIFVILQKRENFLAWIISLISLIYTGIIYTLIYPNFNVASLIIYLILLWDLYRYFSAKNLFITKKF